VNGFDPLITEMDFDFIHDVRWLEEESCREPLSVRRLISLTGSDHPAFVAIVNGKVVGHCIAVERKGKPGWFELLSVVVLKEFRRNMIGSTLLDRLNTDAYDLGAGLDFNKIVANVPEDRVGACCFLRANDFRVNEIVKRPGLPDLFVFERYVVHR
jgi:GNAT superfamily N-acetyltransferase